MSNEKEEKKISLVEIAPGLQSIHDSTSSVGSGGYVQLFLEPNESIFIENESLCWSSSNIRVVHLDTNVFSRLLRVTKYFYCQLVNEGTVPSYVGLSLPVGGKILTIKPPSPLANGQKVGLYCMKDAFLCASSKIAMKNIYSSKIMAMGAGVNSIPLSNPCVLNAYHMEGQTGAIFLQSSSEILKKSLKENESILVNFLCLVAFHDSCVGTIALTHAGGVMVKITGPGDLYFAPHAVKRLYNEVAACQRVDRSFRAAKLIQIMIVIGVLGLIYHILSGMLVEINIMEVPE